MEHTWSSALPKAPAGEYPAVLGDPDHCLRPQHWSWTGIVLIITFTLPLHSKQNTVSFGGTPHLL